TPEPLPPGLRLKESRSGLLAYLAAENDSLRKVLLSKKREVWIMAQHAPKPKPKVEPNKAAAKRVTLDARRTPAPAAAERAAPKKARVFRSNTRGTGAVIVSGRTAVFASEAAAAPAIAAGGGAAVESGAGAAVAGAAAGRAAPQAAKVGLPGGDGVPGGVRTDSFKRWASKEVLGDAMRSGEVQKAQEFIGSFKSKHMSVEQAAEAAEKSVASWSTGRSWSGSEWFAPELLAATEGRPVCRLAGMLCRAPGGELFSIEPDAVADRLGWPRLSEVLAAGTVVFPSPLVLDLDGDGVRSAERKVRYDINGDGVRDRFFDVSSKDGVLVFDADGDAAAGEHARELFGTGTDLDGNGRPDGFRDGFAAFAAFVKRAGLEAKDGWLDAGRLAAAGLRIRLGGLRGKTVSLKEAGVARIRVSDAAPVRVEDFDGQGNDTMRQAGARFERLDGTAGDYEDVWFKASTARDLLARR
ncbi:MAG: hypothetical protein HY553_18215, partial [Elusimicrobia bacterium]|nr:hypothetical protein [Elusimicrobiota bacterium]